MAHCLTKFYTATVRSDIITKHQKELLSIGFSCEDLVYTVQTMLTLI